MGATIASKGRRLRPETEVHARVIAPVPDLAPAAPALVLVPAPSAETIDETRLAGAASRRRMRTTAWTGVIVAILCPLATLAGGPAGIALAGALLAAAVGSGAGVLCWIDAGDGPTQAGLTLVTSLALFALTATVLLWLHAWQTPLMWTPVALSAASCAVRLWGKR